MINITKKIEHYIRKHFGGEIFAAYGSSLGGSFVGLLIQRRMIHIEHGIIGSSDLDQSGRFSALLQTKLLGNMFYNTLSFERQFYSDLITALDDNISVPNTTIHVFYALQMGEKYRLRYIQHFAEPDIIEHDYGHEELLFFYPEKWVNEVKRCVGSEYKNILQTKNEEEK